MPRPNIGEPLPDRPISGGAARKRAERVRRDRRHAERNAERNAAEERLNAWKEKQLEKAESAIRNAINNFDEEINKAVSKGDRYIPVVMVDYFHLDSSGRSAFISSGDIKQSKAYKELKKFLEKRGGYQSKFRKVVAKGSYRYGYYLHLEITF